MEDGRPQHIRVQRQESYQPEEAWVDVTNISGHGGQMDISLWSNGQLPKGSPTKIQLRWGPGYPYAHFEENLAGELITPALGRTPFSYAIAADVLRELLPAFHGLDEKVRGEEAQRILSCVKTEGVQKINFPDHGSHASGLHRAVFTLPKSTLVIGYAVTEANQREYTATLTAAHRTLIYLLND